MNIFVEFDDHLNENRIRYVLEFIERHPLNEGRVAFHFNKNRACQAKLIYSLSDSVFLKEGFFIPAQALFFSKQISQTEIQQPNPLSLSANQYLFENYKIFSVENQIKGTRQFFEHGNFTFDIIETIFFHISRYEEHAFSNPRLDSHGRTLASSQFLVINRLEKIPVVDHLIYCFLKIIRANPKHLNTKLKLSYDIDIVRCFKLRPPIALSIKYIFNNPISVIKLWVAYSKSLFPPYPDPYLIFDWMLRPINDIEQTIYFLVNGRTKFDKPIVNINDEFKNIVYLAMQQGLTIGIHPSYDCISDLNLFNFEKETLASILKREVVFSRQHFLHFSWEYTPAIFEKLGVQEDSSLGFPDRIGFRCGTGFPYRPYCFKEERAWNFVTVPMVCMDIALFREAKQNNVEVPKLFYSFLKANQFLTQITFLFHNSRFFDAELEGIDLKSLFDSLRYGNYEKQFERY